MKKMIDILGYLRGLLGFGAEDSRKRRAEPDDSRGPSSTKYRKVSIASPMSSYDDDWISLATSSRRTSFNNTNSMNTSTGTKPKSFWSKVPQLDTSEDDDDIIDLTNKIKLKKLDQKQTRFTSTPYIKNSRHSLNKDEDNDVVYIGTKTAKKNDLSMLRNSKSYLTPTLNNSKENKSDFLQPDNIKSNIKSLRFQPSRSATLEQTFRLDEKEKYSRLLNNAASNAFSYKSNHDSFPKFYTPVGKQFTFDRLSRGKYLTNLAAKNKDTPGFDVLTETPPALRNGSTKNKILKVLDKFPNDSITIKDSSDDDVEIVKFEKVDRKTETPVLKKINSLQKVVGSVPATSDLWITNKLHNYKSGEVKKLKDVEEQQTYRERFSTINTELRTKLFEEYFQECMKIKDTLIPVEEKEPILPELTEEQESIVTKALIPRPPQQVLINKFAISITRADIHTLSGLNWLNDEIINFYVNLLMERSKENSQLPKVFSFNTFFYPKFQKDGYMSLKRWTKKVDLFAQDIVVVPIHLGMHWCMAIIDFRSNVISYYDSMGGDNELCLELLMQYLKEEHLEKKNSHFNNKGWETTIVKSIPQQMNGSDCGMFSCMFAEYITRNAKITFDQKHMPYFRRKMIYEIISGKLLM